MMKLAIVTAFALLSSISLANADNPLIPNDNDHMAALNTTIERGRQIVSSTYQDNYHEAMMAPATVGPVSPGFLLHSNTADHRVVENQYSR